MAGTAQTRRLAGGHTAKIAERAQLLPRPDPGALR
jgi:hypothetical protein